MKFKNKLIELRKKAGISQEELGNKLNVSRQTISKWELGETTPEMDKLIGLSELFNISLDELIKEKDKEYSNDNKNQYKKIINVLMLVIILLLGLFILKDNLFKKSNDDSNKLTINKVKEIAQKGEGISWSDFENYKGKEIGSGLRIIYYEIEGMYDLMIGGTSEYEKPMYVRLILDENKDEYIDIRNESIDKFIKDTKKISTADVPVSDEIVDTKKE